MGAGAGSGAQAGFGTGPRPVSAQQTGEVPPLRLAYLSSKYPAISHTFILREVEALRRLGVEIQTLSIRRTPADEQLSQADRAAADSTVSILPVAPGRLLECHARAFIDRPIRYLRTLARAARLSPGGVRGGLWRLFYFAESIVLWDECRRRGLRHVHVHIANVAADVALLATAFGHSRREPSSWSFTMHGPTEFYNLRQYRLAEKVRDARFVVCISDFARSQLMGLVDPQSWGKLHVVHCGLDRDAFRPAPQPATGAGELRILNVGRLVPEKGHALLLEAMRILRDSGVDARLTIVGDGPLRTVLEAEAAAGGIADRVDFTGAVGQDRIRELYRANDVFCLSSFAEGLPVVLMEAMATGLTVVATRIMGVPELVEDGVSGLLCAPGRADELAAALERLSEAPDLRRRLGEAAREKVGEEFNVAKSAEQLRKTFLAYIG